jgi:hypothetical protein
MTQLKQKNLAPVELEDNKSSGVDRALVAMFLKMSPEERLEANDNAARAILELRDVAMINAS